jgi:hypothetical protein
VRRLSFECGGAQLFNRPQRLDVVADLLGWNARSKCRVQKKDEAEESRCGHMARLSQRLAKQCSNVTREGRYNRSQCKGER